VFRISVILIAAVLAAALRAEESKPDPVAKQLAETLARMEQMDKEWKDGRATKEVKAAEKAAQEKAEKPKKSEADGDAAERREKANSDREAAEKAAKKAAKEEEKARKKAREQAEKQYRDRDDGGARYRYADERSSGRARVYYNGHAVEEGQWTEIGGVTSSSSSSSSGIGGYSNQGNHSSSSIGVRATVIRLDGPPED
jgi:hypothetical protein